MGNYCIVSYASLLVLVGPYRTLSALIDSNGP